MPASSPADKEKKRRIKTELETLLSDFGNQERLEDDVINAQLQEIVQAPPIDFEEMNAKFEARAKEITDSVFKFYLTLGLLDEHDYLVQKKKLDSDNISNIFFLVKTTKFAIEKIMQEINAGSTHARLFEVLGQLQDKLANAIKTQANYVLFLEDSYKKIKNDVDNKGDGQNKITNEVVNGQSYITAGTKNMIKTLQGQPSVDNLVVDTNSNLIDPRRKDELMEDRGLSHLKSKLDSDDYDFSEEVAELI